MSTIRRSSIFVIAMLAGAVAGVCGPPEARPATGAVAFAIQAGLARGTERFDHPEWDRLLRTATHDGLVDYRKMGAERPALDAYLARVARAPLARLAAPELEALLVNAYNALTVRSILEQPDVRSIREIRGVFTSARHRVGGFDVSLDLIEHNLLRPFFEDPRLHFVLNCASRSCAPLPSFAYRGDQLEQQLEEAARRFLTDRANVRVRGDTLELSSYFQWFGSDFATHGFKGAQPTIPLYVKRYARPEVAALIDRHAGRPPVRHIPYDWSLNSVERRAAASAGAGAGGWLSTQARRLREWTAGLGAAGPLVFGLLYALLVVVLVPAAPLTIAAGASFGVALGFLVVSLASTLGAVIAFLVARHALRDRVRAWVAKRPAFARIDAASGREGVKLVALSRLSPVLPFNVLNYAFGVTRVRLRTYALVSWIAMAPGTLLYVAAGALAVDIASAGGTALGQASAWLRVLGIAATAVLVWWLASVARSGLGGEPDRDEHVGAHPVGT